MPSSPIIAWPSACEPHRSSSHIGSRSQEGSIYHTKLSNHRAYIRTICSACRIPFICAIPLDLETTAADVYRQSRSIPLSICASASARAQHDTAAATSESILLLSRIANGDRTYSIWRNLWAHIPTR